MMGYLNRPEETAAVAHGDWYITGDIVVIDSDGFIRIVDRQSRFSKIGGEMIPHGKVEDALRDVVKELPCVVTSVADERKGERLVALIEALEGEMDPKDIWKGLMASDLPKLWIPKADNIRIVAALSMLGTGKIDLRAAKRMAAESAATAHELA
jgi:acyl-[acyl-carrier-protein]-phospholipid O-acyltransferase/long-chain-fatty-acid--[acyl-carrier-protein] ligase